MILMGHILSVREPREVVTEPQTGHATPPTPVEAGCVLTLPESQWPSLVWELQADPCTAESAGKPLGTLVQSVLVGQGYT